MPKTAVRIRHPHIVIRKGFCGGSPVIAGTKFPVRSVVNYVLRQGMTPEELAAEFDWHKFMTRSPTITTTNQTSIRTLPPTARTARAGSSSADDGESPPTRRSVPETGRPHPPVAALRLFDSRRDVDAEKTRAT
jgi:uncharacterized protein (DUF433 family)